MQDSLTTLCCGAVFGVLAVAIVMALLKRRGSATVTPSSSATQAPSNSVEGKHLADAKSVEGKRLAEAKSIQGKHLAETKPVKSKHLVEPTRSKDVAKKHVEHKPSKSEYHSARPEGERSKSIHKQDDTAKTGNNDDNPRFHKS